jgi:DNA polymerase-3 subunit epsilon
MVVSAVIAPRLVDADDLEGDAGLPLRFGRAGLAWPKPPIVDTVRLLLAKARLGSPDLAGDQVELNLSAARAEHGLPDYQAHDPLTDAVAAAELFLALRIAIGARTVRDLQGR